MVKNPQFPSFARSFGAALAASALALLLVASAGRADSSSVTWTAPTPADRLADCRACLIDPPALHWCPTRAP